MKSGTLVRYLKGTGREGEVYIVIDETTPAGLIALSEDGENFDHAGALHEVEVIDLG